MFPFVYPTIQETPWTPYQQNSSQQMRANSRILITRKLVQDEEPPAMSNSMPFTMVSCLVIQASNMANEHRQNDCPHMFVPQEMTFSAPCFPARSILACKRVAAPKSTTMANQSTKRSRMASISLSLEGTMAKEKPCRSSRKSFTA